MPQRLFIFVQMEFPWALGPADGRYLLRAPAMASPSTWSCWGRSAPAPLRRGRAAGARPAVIRGDRRRGGRARIARSGARDHHARDRHRPGLAVRARGRRGRWLADLDRERDVLAAMAVVNRVVHSHRIAPADPYVHEVSPGQALVIRAGWGEGEQVADGRWLHAREAAGVQGGARRGARPRTQRARSSALRPQERLAVAARRARQRPCCARSSRCAPAWTSTRAACATPRSSSTGALTRRRRRAARRATARISRSASPSSSSCDRAWPRRRRRRLGRRQSRRWRRARRSGDRATLLEAAGGGICAARTAPASGASLRVDHGPDDDRDRHLERRALHALRRAARRGAPDALLRPGDGIDTVITADAYGAGEADRAARPRARRASRARSYCLVGAIGHDFYDGRARRRQGLSALHRSRAARRRTSTRDYIRMATERSLERCGVEHFDLLLLHNPDRIGYSSPAVWDGHARAARGGADAPARRRPRAGQRLHARSDRLPGALRAS